MKATYHRLYKTARWQRLRLQQLRRKPYCQSPACKGKFTKASVVDHIIAHKGDRGMFYNRDNLQSLCKLCHDKFKQSHERGGRGFNRGCDQQGYPLDDATE